MSFTPRRRQDQRRLETRRVACPSCGAAIGSPCLTIQAPRTRPENLGKPIPNHHSSRRREFSRQYRTEVVSDRPISPLVQDALVLLQQAREDLTQKIAQVESAIGYLTAL